MKKCSHCGEIKPFTEFNKERNRKDGKARYCQPCARVINKKWRESRPDLMRNAVLLKNHGITSKQYDEMLALQGGVCAICFNPEVMKGRPLAVDHDHATSKIRGLLCNACNSGLGQFRDSPQRLRGAAHYLITHGKEP